MRFLRPKRLSGEPLVAFKHGIWCSVPTKVEQRTGRGAYLKILRHPRRPIDLLDVNDVVVKHGSPSFVVQGAGRSSVNFGHNIEALLSTATITRFPPIS
jgi:hypothetical protein